MTFSSLANLHLGFTIVKAFVTVNSQRTIFRGRLPADVGADSSASMSLASPRRRCHS